MKTTFIIKSGEESEENIIKLTFIKPIKFPKFINFIKDSIKVKEMKENPKKISFIFDNSETGFSILQSLFELFVEKYSNIKSSNSDSVLYDENMRPIPRPKKKGKIRKIQKPTPNESLL